MDIIFENLAYAVASGKRKLQLQLRLLLGFSYKASTTAHYIPKCTGFTSFVLLCSTQRKEQHACAVHDVFHEHSLCTLPYVKKAWVLASRESYSLLQFSSVNHLPVRSFNACHHG